jgi:hypothetical protein
MTPSVTIIIAITLCTNHSKRLTDNQRQAVTETISGSPVASHCYGKQVSSSVNLLQLIHESSSFFVQFEDSFSVNL